MEGSQVLEEPEFVSELASETEVDSVHEPWVKSEAAGGTGSGSVFAMSNGLGGNLIPKATSASIWGKVRSIRLLT